MSHSLPHMTLTTNTISLSPISSTSPIFPTVSPSHKIYDPRPIFTLRCSTAEWRINANPISHSFRSLMRADTRALTRTSLMRRGGTESESTSLVQVVPKDVASSWQQTLLCSRSSRRTRKVVQDAELRLGSRWQDCFSNKTLIFKRAPSTRLRPYEGIWLKKMDSSALEALSVEEAKAPRTARLKYPQLGSLG